MFDNYIFVDGWKKNMRECEEVEYDDLGFRGKIQFAQRDF